MSIKRCEHKVKGYYYWCMVCGREIDSYEYYKNEGLCDYCVWGVGGVY